MNPIPYIEHSFLSIDRKIFVKYRFLSFSFFFRISKAAYHKHPTPYDYKEGGLFAFWIKQSRRGFIATFILKETEEPTFSQ